jgi:LPS sulfotransferase NodH
VQTVYFAADGLIVRHDYVADIVGSLARGAHFWRDYVTVDGIPIATRRIVYARLFRQPLPIVALDAQFEPPSVTLAPSRAS